MFVQPTAPFNESIDLCISKRVLLNNEVSLTGDSSNWGCLGFFINPNYLILRKHKRTQSRPVRKKRETSKFIHYLVGLSLHMFIQKELLIKVPEETQYQKPHYVRRMSTYRSG